MAEGDVTLRPGTEGGQVGEGSEGIQATQAAPAPGEGQLNVGQGSGTTIDGSGTQAPPEQTFFDPKELEDDPRLMAAYKNMQRSYTKKMQGFKDLQQKVDAYDAFYQNPQEQVQKLLNQWGYQMVPAGQGNAQTPDSNEPWTPQSWDEVASRIREDTRRELMEELKPFFGQFQDLRQTTIENQLSEIDPAWHQYEDSMKMNLAKHPSLAQDPGMLYRMSVPQEVLESRATQAALRKLEAQSKSSAVSGGSTTTKTPQQGLPDRPLTFSESVEAAKKKMAEDGITLGT